MDGNIRTELPGKREQILEASIRIFAEKGYFNAKVEEIAVEAGVGKGTVYEYFKSKQDLFQEMFKHIHTLYYNEFTADLRVKETLREKLMYLIEAHLRFIGSNQAMAQVFLAEQPPIHEGFMQWLIRKEKEKMEILEDYVTQSMLNREIRPIDPKLLAKLIAGIITSLGNCAILGEGATCEEEYGRLAQDTVSILYQGLAE